MNVRIHWWIPCAAIIVAVYAGASLLLHPGYFVSTFGNVVQTALLLLLLTLTGLNASRNRGRTRYFWASLALGSGLWLSATLLWTLYEVVLRKDVPMAFLGDILFFIHIVPMMGALATRPHVHHARRIEFGHLDFTLLLLWWVYLYCFIVIPWQYVLPDITLYGLSFDVLYLIENLVLLAALIPLTLRVRGPWRAVYAPFLVGASIYTIGSQLVNHAITAGKYYTGSIYDIPIIISMTIFVGISLVAAKKSAPPQQKTSRWNPLMLSRISSLAVLSPPLILSYSVIFGAVPQKVVVYRTLLTMVALLVMASIIFLKQHMMQRELLRLLGASQHNYENLKRLQGQLIQAEKLSALSRFVAGAAHQINNPLTAVIGYADLLEHECPPDDERGQWAIKIGQQARRTQELVKNLLSFSRQMPGDKGLIEVNPLVANAIDLRELDLLDASIHIVRKLDSRSPRVFADGNQLLQVCFHIIGNAIDALKSIGGGVLTVSTRLENEQVLIEFADDGPGILDPKKIFDPFYTTKPVGKASGLGLSACYGIISEHGGTIVCENRPEGGASFIVQLPVYLTAVARSAETHAKATV
jgi:signal transduction histidine kinase